MTGLLALPPNSTSVTQPLDVGVIAVFKRKYRASVLRKTAIERARKALNPVEGSPYKITNLQGWCYIVKAWHEVKQECIRHCFHHVPIFEDKQKELLLASETDGSDIAEALEYFRSDVLSLYQLNDIMDAELR
ncbi:hypothetical protein BX616_009225, partial [Lobosporangium transversale]